MAVVYWIRAPHHTDIFTEGYVGFSSKSTEDRLKTHKNDAKRFPHFPVYRAMEKYGDNIVVETVLEGSDEYCLGIEFKLRPEPKIGWNLNCGGGKGPLGTKASDETRRKQSELRKGDKNHFFGKIHTEETRKKISEARKNFTPEQKEKYIVNGMKGKKHTEEAKRRISEAGKGKTWKCDREPWDHYAASKDIWLLCADIYSFLSSGGTYEEVPKKFGTTKKKLRTVFGKLMSGWNPLSDAAWLEYYKNNTPEVMNG